MIEFHKLNEPFSYDKCIFCNHQDDFLVEICYSHHARVFICNHCLIDFLVSLSKESDLIKRCLVGANKAETVTPKTKRKKLPKVLNAYECYVEKFARTHNISIEKAMLEPAVQARKRIFLQTGK